MTPQGWKDTFVRAAKTAVQVFIGAIGTNVAGWTDLAALQAAGLAAASAAASVIINAVLVWTNSDS